MKNFTENLLCNLRVGLSPWSCRRGIYGEGWGSGNEETSWVWSLYQCGSSSNNAVSNSIKIYKAKRQRIVIEILWNDFIIIVMLLGQKQGYTVELPICSTLVKYINIYNSLT